MQYLARAHWDRLSRAALRYDCRLDRVALRKAVVAAIDKIPVLRSSYRADKISPHWTVESYAPEDILTICDDCSDIERRADDFALGANLPADGNVQVKIGLFCSKTESILVFVINHMCVDGADFIYFMRKICEAYSAASNGRPAVEIKAGTRDFFAVLSGFSGARLETAKSILGRTRFEKNVATFPFERPGDADAPFMVRRALPKDELGRLCAVCKSMGATVTDALISAFARTLYDFCGFDESMPIQIMCMVDLRRHIKDADATTGLTNHAGYADCRLFGPGPNARAALKATSEIMRERRADPFLGLHCVPVLPERFRRLPHFAQERIIKSNFVPPEFSISNLGLLSPEAFAANGALPSNIWIGPPAMRKPQLLIAVASMRKTLTLCTTLIGTAADRKLLCEFFDRMIGSLCELAESCEEG